jgi:hypothetical protein
MAEQYRYHGGMTQYKKVFLAIRAGHHPIFILTLADTG